MSQEQVSQFIEEAQQSLQSGQFDSALELIDQAIALDENNSDPYVYRGIALSQLGRPEEATEAFRNAIMHGPYNPKAYFNLAVHYYQLGQAMQAEEMAKETMKIEPNHPGARDLLIRIENERKPAAPQSSIGAFPGDPLAAPPSSEPPKPVTIDPGASSPSSEGPVSQEPPLQQPYQTQQPYGGPPQTPVQPTGYYRPGYDTSGTHSLQFIANMGKGWDTFGWILAIGTMVVGGIVWASAFSIMAQVFSNPEAFAGSSPWMTPGVSVPLQILDMVGRLVALVWMILELADRRGNWLWILPFVICCCCNLPGVVMAIYLWKGRQ